MINYDVGSARVQYFTSDIAVGQTVTMVASRDKGANLVPFYNKDGQAPTRDTGLDNNQWIYNGKKSKGDVLEIKKAEIKGALLVMRIVGFLCMWGSLMLITGPIEEMA